MRLTCMHYRKLIRVFERSGETGNESGRLVRGGLDVESMRLAGGVNGDVRRGSKATAIRRDAYEQAFEPLACRDAVQGGEPAALGGENGGGWDENVQATSGEDDYSRFGGQRAGEEVTAKCHFEARDTIQRSDPDQHKSTGHRERGAGFGEAAKPRAVPRFQPNPNPGGFTWGQVGALTQSLLHASGSGNCTYHTSRMQPHSPVRSQSYPMHKAALAPTCTHRLQLFRVTHTSQLATD
eukprot:1189097-Prorocentrum_minimum.AAC.1